MELEIQPYNIGLKNMALRVEPCLKYESTNIGALLVQIIQCGIDEESLIHDGLEGLPQKDRLFTQAKNGKTHVLMFGNGILLPAKDANFIKKNLTICRFTSITLNLLPIKS